MDADVMNKSSVGVLGSLYAFLGLPWDILVAIATFIYMIVCIVQKIKEMRKK